MCSAVSALVMFGARKRLHKSRERQSHNMGWQYSHWLRAVDESGAIQQGLWVVLSRRGTGCASLQFSGQSCELLAHEAGDLSAWRLGAQSGAVEEDTHREPGAWALAAEVELRSPERARCKAGRPLLSACGSPDPGRPWLHFASQPLGFVSLVI